ncbi:unnamed protein product [Microthlaspi erraticum]|uniref:Replication factor A C-terminal domain-containing protein n=1 Tax=Microthlaspi erraticum TaxID=1685480 RepID=A0A6D2HS82_9BRAS|nr:unnamed protein product [Microthlaspi erraticum]
MLYLSVGQLQITNAFDASKLMINPDCPEANDFRERLPADGLTIVIKEEDATDLQVQLEKKEEEWHSYAICSVSELLDCDQIEQKRIVCVVGSIDTDFGWYYFGCGTCQHRVSKDLKKEASTKPKSKVPIWWCQQCKTNTKKVAGKFKLHLNVYDGTGEARIMLLDNIAESIVTKSAAFLLNGSFDEIQDPDQMPDSLRNLVGKTFEFLVGVEKEHISYGNDTYKVHKVHTGEGIVKKDSSHDVISRVDTVSQIVSTDEASAVKSNYLENSEAGATPSSKRQKDEVEGVTDNGSASKKHCNKVIDLEDINGENDVELPAGDEKVNG